MITTNHYKFLNSSTITKNLTKIQFPLREVFALVGTPRLSWNNHLDLVCAKQIVIKNNKIKTLDIYSMVTYQLKQ